MKKIFAIIVALLIAAIFFPLIGVAFISMAILALFAIVGTMFSGSGGFESVKTRTVTADGWTKTTTTRWRNGKLISAEFTEGES